MLLWNSVWVIKITLIFLSWLPRVNNSHTPNRRRLADRQGSRGKVRRLHYQSLPVRLVKCHVRRQFLKRGQSNLLTVAPHYPTGICRFGAEVVEVLVEAYDEWRHPGTNRSNYDTRERMPKFQIITHGCSEDENAPLRRHSPYLYPKGTDELSAKHRRLKNEILYNLFWGSVILETISSPAFLLRLIFLSVRTVTCRILVPS